MSVTALLLRFLLRLASSDLALLRWWGRGPLVAAGIKVVCLGVLAVLLRAVTAVVTGAAVIAWLGAATVGYAFTFLTFPSRLPCPSAMLATLLPAGAS